MKRLLVLVFVLTGCKSFPLPHTATPPLDLAPFMTLQGVELSKAEAAQITGALQDKNPQIPNPIIVKSYLAASGRTCRILQLRRSAGETSLIACKAAGESLWHVRPSLVPEKWPGRI